MAPPFRVQFSTVPLGAEPLPLDADLVRHNGKLINVILADLFRLPAGAEGNPFGRLSKALVVVAILAFDPCIAQSPAPPYPPPGQLVDMGGYRVHLYCTGEGSPTVVVVGAGFSFDWDLVQSDVAKFTRICTYDVSGTAWSDPGPLLTCSERVNEVHKLLNKARIGGPYLLVGLSVGALVARLYASENPGEVAGMVIVDHAFIDIGGNTASRGANPGPDSPPILIYKTPIMLTVEDTSDFGKLPERVQALHRWAVSLNPVLPTVETVEDCLTHLKGKTSLRNLPLVVVSTGNNLPNYKKLQTELLSLSTRSKQLIADRSFHSVEIDQPELVVDAIQQVVNMVRRTGERH